jgi:hypothetical protein
VGGSDDCEVAVVERGDLGHVVAFGNGDDRGVNEPESELGVDAGVDLIWWTRGFGVQPAMAVA